MINFLFSKVPNRKRKDVYVVTTDGFVTQETVTDKFELPNAIYMADRWHLLDSILPNRFGKVVFEKITHFLRGMCNARSAQQFEKEYSSARSVLESIRNRNYEHIVSLEKFSRDRKNYTDYILSTNRGTRGYHGSSCAEQNHSSLLIHLNDGYRTGNQYFKDPHTFLKDTFQCRQKHVN